MRKFLAVLLILIFIPIYITIFLAFNLQAVFFDEEVAKGRARNGRFPKRKDYRIAKKNKYFSAEPPKTSRDGAFKTDR